MKRVLLGVMLLTAACDSSNDRLDGGSGGGGNGDGGGALSDDLSFDNDAFYINDPPQMFCSLDGGVFPPPKPPGGTLDCPDDKNREGCPCPAEGMTAACWPGARANRNLGICKDGMTTCVRQGEISLGWGPCMGYQLPTPGVTDGAQACKCFSHGTWKLDNLSPCFFNQMGQPAGSAGAVSTVPAAAGKYQCPMPPDTLPTANWSTDTITADCSGRFTLCLTLKAGNAASPQPGDCEVAHSCVTGDYVDVNKAQTFPPLPPWLATSPAQQACSQKFATTGGYGEMSVDGLTVTCDKFSRVFNRVNYCPLTCNTNPTDPACTNCMQGGSGSF
jgi:hypothetical protein